MDINKRIADLKPFFVAFNVAAEDDASYIVIKVPSHWTVEPLISTFRSEYQVETVVRSEGVYFFTEIKNGVEPLFDCADTIISYNKNLEARKTLLKEKIDELTSIFATEPLEKLETLTFKMENEADSAKSEKPADKLSKRGKKAAKTPEQAIEDTLKSTVAEKIEPKEESKAEEVEEENDDNSLMALAKGLTGE